MFDLRAPLILAAAPVGATLGAAVWLLLGQGAGVLEPVANMQIQFAVNRSHARHAVFTGMDPVAQAVAQPLFALTSGPGAVSDVLVRLEGVARTGRRTAALLSINGAPAAWLELGETRDGVTLQDVQGTKVVLDTATGFKDVGLYDGPSGGQDAASPTPAPTPQSGDSHRHERR